MIVWESNEGGVAMENLEAMDSFEKLLPDDEEPSEEDGVAHWSLKRTLYCCVCITPEYHGSGIVWSTLEDAWADAKERAQEYLDDNPQRFAVDKVYDGYQIIDKPTNTVIMHYKIFDVQELE